MPGTPEPDAADEVVGVRGVAHTQGVDAVVARAVHEVATAHGRAGVVIHGGGVVTADAVGVDQGGHVGIEALEALFGHGVGGVTEVDLEEVVG